MARGTTAATSSPRLTSSSRNPPATAVSSTSLTVASCACATALTGSRLLRMRRIRRSAPTTLLRLLRGVPRSANAVRAVCQAGPGMVGAGEPAAGRRNPVRQPGPPPVPRVLEQRAGRRDRSRGPRPRRLVGRVGGGVKQCAQHAQCRGPVGDRVMHAQVEADLPSRQAGQEPESATAAGSAAAAAGAAARRRRPAAVRPRARGPAPPARAGRCRTTAHRPTAAAPAPAGGRRAPDGTAAPGAAAPGSPTARPGAAARHAHRAARHRRRRPTPRGPAASRAARART